MDMILTKFEGMTVKDLRAEMKLRGLPMEHNGKKFKKAELIAKLMDYENQMLYEKKQEEKQKPKERVGGVTKIKESRHIENINASVEEKQKYDNGYEYIKFAKTVEELKTKYLRPKKESVYNKALVAGAFVAFFEDVKAANGKTYTKVRTAKVTSVDNRLREIKAVTLKGTEFLLGYEDVLYIKGVGAGDTYPKDLAMFIKNQKESSRVNRDEKYKNRYNGRNITTKGSYFKTF